MLWLLFDYEAVLLRLLSVFIASEHGRGPQTMAPLHVPAANALYAVRLKRYIQSPPHHCG